MKNILNKAKRSLNEKSKAEQTFLLILLCVGFFGLFCLTGCGGKSCETIKCSSGSNEFIDVKGCSIPGCGGCLTSGKGCDSCLWAQSCKYVSGKASDVSEEDFAFYDDMNNMEDTEEVSEYADSASMRGCDIRYYGDGCLGCAQNEKSCYAGYIDSESGDEYAKGVFYGNSDNEEKLIGFTSEGCAGCVGSDRLAYLTMYLLEEEAELN